MHDNAARKKTPTTLELVASPEVRESGPCPTSRTGLALHLASAVVLLGLTQYLAADDFALFAVGLAIKCWVFEGVRRAAPRLNALLMRLLGPLAHGCDASRVNSATWYATGIAVVAAAHDPVLVCVALAVLGFGDPAATLAGQRWGLRKLGERRTLEGSVAFFVAGSIAAGVTLFFVAPASAFAASWGIASAAAFAGALAEILSDGIDDNFSVPLFAAGAAALVLA